MARQYPANSPGSSSTGQTTRLQPLVPAAATPVPSAVTSIDRPQTLFCAGCGWGTEEGGQVRRGGPELNNTRGSSRRERVGEQNTPSRGIHTRPSAKQTPTHDESIDRSNLPVGSEGPSSWGVVYGEPVRREQAAQRMSEGRKLRGRKSSCGLGAVVESAGRQPISTPAATPSPVRPLDLPRSIEGASVDWSTVLFACRWREKEHAQHVPSVP